MKKDYRIRPIAFTSVNLSGFWAARQEINRTVTIPACFQRCEETGRIKNFEKAGGSAAGRYEGRHYNDSDVFKVLEGAAYSLAVKEDPALKKYLDTLISKIAAAQEDDGYLYTPRTIDPDKPPKEAGPRRWSNLAVSHELYNLGHLYEAAVAYYQAAGDKSLLNCALKSADLLCRTFGEGLLHDVPGHQEIEIGLVKLYRVTGNHAYLDLAKFFLDNRGHIELRETGRRCEDPEYMQDHTPVTQQQEAVGHAVRAVYMYAGMADVAALTSDRTYAAALDRIWTDVTEHKLYLTGGIGSRHEGEAFGDPYELPNNTAYNETCAAIGGILWNHRMFLLHGRSEYMDVLETMLYNGFLAGISLSGDRFFYPNPLESDGQWPFNKGSTDRQPWFQCSCCPTNIVRMLGLLPGLFYGNGADGIYVNLYGAGEAEIEIGGSMFRIMQRTNYPWSGRIALVLNPDKPVKLPLMLRIPLWSRAEGPLPGNLYRFIETIDSRPAVEVNGEPLIIREENVRNGYLVIDRTWMPKDEIHVSLPMPPRRVICNEKVGANRKRIALQRGPIVYCFEEADNGPEVLNLSISDSEELESEYRADVPGGVQVLKAGSAVAIPYFSWSHRGAGKMAVWVHRKKNEV